MAGKKSTLMLIAVTLTFLVHAPHLLHAQRTEYFEAPRAIATGESRFPRLITVGERMVVFYQEVLRQSDDDGRGRIHISARWSADGKQWHTAERIIGPIVYAGSNPPHLYSVVATEDGEVYIAVTESAEQTVVYRGDIESLTFSPVHELRTPRANVAPTLSVTAEGRIILFVNQNLEGRQQVVYIRSRDDQSWTEPRPLDSDRDVGLTFIPTHVAHNGREYVVYQGLNITRRSTYQLYLKMSDDGGTTWSENTRLTTFVDPSLSDDANLFDNQRPHIVVDEENGQLLLAWERRYIAGSPQIYVMGLDFDGTPNGLIEEVTGRLELARSPRIVFDGSEPVITWFTNPQGNSRVVLGRRDGFRWVPQRLSPAIGEAIFAEGVSHDGRLHIVWQRRAGEDGAEVVYLEPDQSVEPPVVRGENFRIGERSGTPRAAFRFEDPADASGIRGYSYTWSRDPEAEVSPSLEIRVPERTVSLQADEDGPWYLKVRATDFAGNWSPPTTVTFYLDNTPPGPVTFPPPPVDENGYLVSNTFQVRWEPPEEEEDLGGYSVRLDYLGDGADQLARTLPVSDGGQQPIDAPAVSQRVTHTSPVTGGRNLADGVWLLTVAAVDGVGNVGPPRSMPLRLNKFVPTTQVHSLNIARDLVGRYRLDITGRGFRSNGVVDRVVIDRDGAQPYDYEFNAWQDQFSVPDDRRITGIEIADVETATYLVGLVHPERGLYFSPDRFTLNERGTIRYGDFTPVFEPRYRWGEAPVERSIQDVIFVLILSGSVALILFSALRLTVIAREMVGLGREATILIRGSAVVDAEQRRAQRERALQMKVHWLGLRIKFMFFVVLLVIGVVVLVAVVLGRNVLERQERILVEGLQERIELLVEGQVTGARPALENPQLNLDQLQNLANQGEAMTEALYVSITGIDRQGALQTIYATTDPAVIEGNQDRIDTDSYVIGVSRLNDHISGSIEALAERLNAQAAGEVGDIAVELEQLTQQAQQLILQGAPDGEIERIDQIRTELLRRGRERLEEIAGPIRSEPQFDFADLRRDVTTYLFYKPVLAIVPGAGADFRNYYRGTIRVGISTQLIIDEIDRTRRDLIITTMIIAAAAVGVGILGAYLLATIVVRPILRLVGLVEEITATEDKATLKGRALSLTSRDELQQLATSINQMIEGLVKGAETSKDLLFGKETQKAFIPLERISDDRKKTYGAMETSHARFFGYYEGQRGCPETTLPTRCLMNGLLR